MKATVYFKFFILSIALLSMFNFAIGQSIEKKYLLGQFDESKDKRFVKIEDQHARGSAAGKFLVAEMITSSTPSILAAAAILTKAK